MVAYNTERFIARAIHSVLSQTFRDFELVIVDDGSTDRTPQIAAGFKDSRIRYIRRPHSNAAMARNCAVSESRGRYILIVDSDDSIGPDYLQTMVDEAMANPQIDYVYPKRLTLVNEQAKPVGVHWDYPDFTESKDVLLHLFRLGRLPIPNPGSLIRRNVFLHGGGYENLDTVEDYVFLCRNVMNIRFKRCSRATEYFYRRSDSGLSQRFEIRNQITARVLDEMAHRYPPEHLCPEIASVSDPEKKQLSYFEIIMMTFYRLAELHCGRGDNFFRQKGDPWLGRYMDLARKMDPSCPWLLNGSSRQSAMIRRGFECLRNNQPADALVYLDQAVVINSGIPNLHYARAVAFLQIGRRDQAISSCRSECRIGHHPEAEQLMGRLGILLESTNECHSYQPSNLSETPIPVSTV
jgi:glycosyltransferase involved in cell wall biosynthesis